MISDHLPGVSRSRLPDRCERENVPFFELLTSTNAWQSATRFQSKQILREALEMRARSPFRLTEGSGCGASSPNDKPSSELGISPRSIGETLDVFEFLEGASLTRLDYRQSTASLRRRVALQDYVALREKGPRFSGLSLAWADTAQLTIQTLPQPSLPHLLDRRGPESAVKEGRKEEFCVGELPQDVGDVLGGMLEQAGIGVVIHHADIGMKGASVKGVEDGASHALSHSALIGFLRRPNNTNDCLLNSIRLPSGDSWHIRVTPRPNPVFAFSHCRHDPSRCCHSRPHANSGLYPFHTSRVLSHFLSNPILTPVEEAERQPSPTLKLAHEQPLDELVRFAEVRPRGKRATFYASASSSLAHHLTNYWTSWGMNVERLGVDSCSEEQDGVGDSVNVSGESAGSDTGAAIATGTATPTNGASASGAGGPSFIGIDNNIPVLCKWLLPLRVDSSCGLFLWYALPKTTGRGRDAATAVIPPNQATCRNPWVSPSSTPYQPIQRTSKPCGMSFKACCLFLGISTAPEACGEVEGRHSGGVGYSQTCGATEIPYGSAHGWDKTNAHPGRRRPSFGRGALNPHLACHRVSSILFGNDRTLLDVPEMMLDARNGGAAPQPVAGLTNGSPPALDSTPGLDPISALDSALPVEDTTHISSTSTPAGASAGIPPPHIDPVSPVSTTKTDAAYYSADSLSSTRTAVDMRREATGGSAEPPSG
ncbi:hypothetical protein BDV93DRAFT_548792 [Ceratobasidium sp. AG-I]|nr:hypothetical protein BDV93DRAFT_548792 [Ceratobasidium sp. AG-I]